MFFRNIDVRIWQCVYYNSSILCENYFVSSPAMLNICSHMATNYSHALHRELYHYGISAVFPTLTDGRCIPVNDKCYGWKTLSESIL